MIAIASRLRYHRGLNTGLLVGGVIDQLEISGCPSLCDDRVASWPEN